MKKTEESRAAQKLMKTNNNKLRYAIRLKMLEWGGRRDGKRGLPRMGKNDQWESPRIAQIEGDFSNFEATVYKALQTQLIVAHVELEEHVDMIVTLRARYQEQAKLLADFEKTLVESMPGEENLPQKVIKDRRRWELVSATGLEPLKIQKDLENRISRGIELNALVHQLEVLTSLYGSLAESNVQLFLAAYWRGIVSTNKDQDLPAQPPERNGEKPYSIYSSSHEMVKTKLLGIAQEMKGEQK